MPLDGYLALLWFKYGGNPDDYYEWPADRLFQFIAYNNANQEIEESLNSSGMD